ncbi:acyl-CoA dehydrogenase [Mycobacterium sp. GA-1285]|uniref:acyl-CoA dehydrogenase family protein n=1 Tax=Mycobacterium sp. GA-1285 TaxID=1772282 RepID=UPI000749349E|nr:acyl-CoA dehydrogenase family protein [Mycobacterium sp. GA-1285]KUI20780.1 acyl-CoA dehydrogenase [Mycobacterium sp. GA-1285]
MNLELTDEQLALRETVGRFLSEKAAVSTHVRELLDDPVGTTVEVWKGLTELGVAGLLVTASHGGAGATMTEAGIVAERLGAVVNPGPWLSTAVAAPRALLRTGAGAEAADLLQGIADGSTLATVGPLHGGRPRAARSGAQFRIRGTIEALPDAAAADVLLILAEHGGGVGLFAVEAAHIRVTARAHVDQTRKLFDVVLDDAPARHLAPATADAVGAVVDDVLIAYAADALGAADAVMRLAVDYAKVRKQFGKPIGSFQAVQHLCVDMFETVELARSGVMHALWAADTADPAERHLAALRAKAFAGRLAAVGDTAIQVFGGIGFTWEHDAHLYLKRLLGFSAMLGGTDWYLEEVGRSVVARAGGRERVKL